MPPVASASPDTLARTLVDHADKVRAAWLEAASAELHGRTSRGELEREQTDILDALVDGLRAGGTVLADPAFDQLRGILADVSAARARLGFSPRETATGVFALKEGLYRLTSDDGVEVDTTTLLRLVDHLGLFTFESFAAAREAIIVEQAEQLLELSTPVVKLWDGVVAVPLVGTLDSARTQVVMEKLLNTLVDTGSEHAIIDITGVPAVDTQVAQHLLKTVVAARLMGAECTISGIRPQIAQTIVALGIEFGDIRTKASLADALVAALRSRGAAAPGLPA
ncbi:STAS domain-containing protein [Cellulosimicrobium marinum]|uniref:STAS domain-containing protein n=1 Tax=Cellulosimicrobium marinum TaxID=1638992 RepID=UPI001E5EDCF0|nr:STAS domain-containing protein [Cellulosimicrobium marinum]MCB7136128.1 STAS domain-containing protein [Cellulosimicrobium marinum]